MSPTEPAVLDHLRPVDADHPPGIYRVVGTDEDDVTLLRVGDPEGRRVNTGEVLRVDRAALKDFEPAENPDGNRPIGASLRSSIETGYWSTRTFVQSLLANPLPSAVALAVLLVGVFGDETVHLGDTVAGLLTVAGALALAYVGSGRF